MTKENETPAPPFRTIVECPENRRKINLDDNILSIGSCFSENIASLLNDYRFRITANPNGTLYNPASIAITVDRILSGRRYAEDDLFFSDGEWKSYCHHSRFNSPDRDLCLKNINGLFEEAVSRIEHLDAIIITFGTSFIYRRADNGKVAANCHRLPHDAFVRSLLSPEETANICRELFSRLYSPRPELNIIVTISPVRHLRDNPHENQVSKSHLFTAIHLLMQEFPSVYYFPGYEIMIDDLRDYRFYADDMIHPAPAAVDYIWRRFREACIDAGSREFIERYKPVLAAKKHVVKNSSSEKTAQFAESRLDLIACLQKEFPSACLQEDIDYFTGLL